MDLMAMIKDFIKPELIIVIPVLYLIGIGIKKCRNINKFIPLILGGLGIILSLIYIIATMDIQTKKDIYLMIFTSITQGILLAGASVYINQLIKQSKKKD